MQSQKFQKLSKNDFQNQQTNQNQIDHLISGEYNINQAMQRIETITSDDDDLMQDEQLLRLQSQLQDLQIAMQDLDREHQQLNKQSKDLDIQLEVHKRKDTEGKYKNLLPQLKIENQHLGRQLQQLEEYSQTLASQCKQNQLNNAKKKQANIELQVKALKKQAELNRLKQQSIERKDQIVKLKRLLDENQVQKQIDYQIIKRLIGQLPGSIRVYCRIRPPINIDQNCIKVISQSHLRLIRFQDRAQRKMVEIQNEYVFQKIFKQNETQHQVFRQLSEFIKQSVDGKNVCLFAYGMTGSGKTYTLLGSQNKQKNFLSQQRGIVSRTIQLIFYQIAKMKVYKWNAKIYLQEVINLLPQKCIEVNSIEQALKYLQIGNGKRRICSTKRNQRSSRSHLLITLKIQQVNKRNITIIDLAGNEKLKEIGAENSKETIFINNSLFWLERVINDKLKNQLYIPYSRSKLTQCLQPYLQNESIILNIINICSDPSSANLIKQTLQFAKRTIQKQK